MDAAGVYVLVKKEKKCFMVSQHMLYKEIMDIVYVLVYNTKLVAKKQYL